MIFFHKPFPRLLHIQIEINLKFNTKILWPQSDEWVKSCSNFASTLCAFCHYLFPFMAITNWLHKNIFCSNFTFFDGKPPHQGVSKRLASTETSTTFFSINWFSLKPSFESPGMRCQIAATAGQNLSQLQSTKSHENIGPRKKWSEGKLFSSASWI